MSILLLIKDYNAAGLLQTHITGVLVHGDKTLAILDLMQWPHDSNLAINCMMMSLGHLFKDKPLTETLYIQLDNCGRENKNKYFIGAMAFLVAKGLVKEIVMSFLMTGHTHEGKRRVVVKLTKCQI